MNEPRTPAPRRILLVDCDQFFVQCARIADPEGAGRTPLLLVGGSVDGRGVVTSASYETRAFGVRSGMPTGRALRLCPEATVVGVPRGLCGEKSRAIRTVLERFAPVVEPASIDEAYMDLSGTEGLYRGEALADTARRVQEAVKAETDIAVSVGGGTAKLIAKLAVTKAKPAGVHVVPPGGEADFMRTLQLAAIPGVGPVFAERLKRLGMVSVEDALKYEEATLGQWLGENSGAWLHRRIRGIDEGRVEPDHEAKSLSRDETFARDLDTAEELETELLYLALKLGRDLREEGLRARTVTVRIRDDDFRNRSAGRTLPEPIESDRALYAVGRELMTKLRSDRRVPARLLSISASGLSSGQGPRQLALFDEAAPEAELETERDRALSRAADDVRRRFGADAVRPGSLLDRRRR
ncbi:MAG: DNA polymerase IV [Gemmatimonadota bacterium]